MSKMAQFEMKIICENDNTVIYNTNNPFLLEKSSTANKKTRKKELSTNYILCWDWWTLSTWICLRLPLFFSFTLSFTVLWLTSIFCLFCPSFLVSFTHTLSTLLCCRRFALQTCLMQYTISTNIATITPTAIHHGQSKFCMLSHISDSIEVDNVEFPVTQRNKQHT